MQTMRMSLLFVALLATVDLSGCGSHPSAAAAGNGQTTTVSINEMAFTPREVKIKAGSTITWANEDVVDHDVTQATPGSGQKPLFKSPSLGQGKTFAYTFTKAGTYPIYCSLPGHLDSGMKMTVTVE